VVPIPGLPRVVADLPVPERPTETIRAAVHEVLARPEFRRPSPGWLQRLRMEIVDLLERIVGSLLGGGRGSVVAWLVVAAAVVAISFVAIRFARGVTRDPGRAVPRLDVRRRAPAEWLAEAEAAERAGRWRLGLRCRYRALVAELAERGLVEEVAGRTSGEYRTEVATSVPGVTAEFDGATALFERAWYGDLPTGRDETARFRMLADRVLAGAGR
jgi:hypothetical protein